MSTLDQLVAEAQSAFDAMRATTRDQRATWLEALADALAEARHDLVPVADRETNLGPARLYGEVLRTVQQLEMCASELREGSVFEATIDTPIAMAPPYGRPDLRRINVGFGPVAVFAASNFPFAFSVLGNDVASAIAAGCSVVLKPHVGHAELSLKVFELADRVLTEQGAPKGTLALFHARDHADNRALVTAPGIKAAGFTGSTGGGKALLDAIATRPDPIPFFGELGAVNPVAVLPAACAARGAALGAELAGGAAMGMGQFCTNPGILFVPAGAEGDALVATFEEAISGLPCHALLNQRITDGYDRALAAVKAQDSVTEIFSGDLGRSVLTTDIAAFLAEPELSEEVFGPSTLIVRYADPADLSRAFAKMPGSLTASIHGDDADADLTRALVAEAQQFAGRILFAGVPPGVALAHAMVHGGPWPSGSRSDTTSVGTASVGRWLRPVCFQSAPQDILPVDLRDAGTGILRRINGQWTTDDVGKAEAKPFRTVRDMDAWMQA